MTSEQEQKLFEAVDKLRLDKVVEKFVIGMQTANGSKRWFTPKELGLKALAVSARLSPPEIRMILVAIHGAIDILGFRETVRLAMILRRKHGTKPRTKEA